MPSMQGSVLTPLPSVASGNKLPQHQTLEVGESLCPDFRRDSRLGYGRRNSRQDGGAPLLGSGIARMSLVEGKDPCLKLARSEEGAGGLGWASRDTASPGSPTFMNFSRDGFSVDYASSLVSGKITFSRRRC